MSPPAQPQSWRLEGVRVLPAPGERVFDGAIEIENGVIRALGPDLPPPAAGVARLERPGMLVLPGFIQGHVHLCQTLFRGLADDLPLDRWLRERIWPLEAAHDEMTLWASAQLGIAEALLHGATTLLDMGTVHHTAVIAEAAVRAGVRIVLGNALMDMGEGVPPGLRVTPAAALAETIALHDRWHGAHAGRIQVALAPRFTLSVSEPLWRDIAALAHERDLPIHTHISETPWENETCRALHGCSPVEALERWGVLAARTILVHAIWLEHDERRLLAQRAAAIIHCPGSNAKLGSGVADIAPLIESGIAIGLGSDGSACNDALSVMAEMRLAAQLASLKHGPGRLSATKVLAMATSLGARALGLHDRVGRLAPGMRADFILFEAAELAWEEDADLPARLVHASPGLRPREVYVDGVPLVRDGRLLYDDLVGIRRSAAAERARLLTRIERGPAAWTSRWS
jgi:cytosine/adenosine deaminase-related metal-dependent hydrolase